MDSTNLPASCSLPNRTPRLLDGEYVYLRFTPHVIQAWKTPAELTDRHIMRDGQWLA